MALTILKTKPNFKLSRGLCYSLLSHLLLAVILIYAGMHTNKSAPESSGSPAINAVMIDLNPASAVAQTEMQPADEPPIAKPEPKIHTAHPVKPIKKIHPQKKTAHRRHKAKHKIVAREKKLIQREQQQSALLAPTQSTTATASARADNQVYAAQPTAIRRRLPEYPRQALSMRIEGQVKVLFDINARGRVENIRIVEAIPNAIFNRSVMAALRSWQYEPRPAKNIAITIVFNRDRSIQLAN